MPSHIHKQINRRAICSALSIWLAVQLAQLLKPVGISMLGPPSLLILGLLMYPVLLLWPLLRSNPTGRFNGEPAESASDRRLNTLISVEVVALCSILIGVVLYL